MRNALIKNLQARLQEGLKELKKSSFLLDLEKDEWKSEDPIDSEIFKLWLTGYKSLDLLSEHIELVAEETFFKIDSYLDSVGVKKEEKNIAYSYAPLAQKWPIWEIPSNKNLSLDVKRNIQCSLALMAVPKDNPFKKEKASAVFEWIKESNALLALLPSSFRIDLTIDKEDIFEKAEASLNVLIVKVLHETLTYVSSKNKPSYRAVAPTHFLSDTYQAFNGIQKQQEWETKTNEQNNLVEEIKIIFPKSKGGMTLKPLEGFGETLIELKKAYGIQAQREFLSAMNLLFWSRIKPDEHGWVFIDEICSLAGIEPSSKNKKSIEKTFRFLANVKLDARPKWGNPIKGALLNIQYEEKNAYRVQIHRGIYECLRNPNGGLGSYYVCFPVDILKEAKNNENIIHLHVKAFQMLRASFSKEKTKEASIKAINLMETLYHLREDRKTHTQEERKLFALLETAYSLGGLQYSLSDNNRNAETVITFEMLEENIEKTEWVPSTGEELAFYLEHNRLTQKELAKRLGVFPKAIRENLKRTNNPLTSSLRKKLVENLRPWFY